VTGGACHRGQPRDGSDQRRSSSPTSATSCTSRQGVNRYSTVSRRWHPPSSDCSECSCVLNSARTAEGPLWMLAEELPVPISPHGRGACGTGSAQCGW